MKALFFGVFFLWVTVSGFGQWLPDNRVDISSVSVQTTGGIAYLTVNYTASCPDYVFKKPVVVEGSNITQQVFLGRPQIWICLDPAPLPEPASAVIALGNLAPGDYSLRVLNGAYFPVLVGWNPIAFTVPASPTITASRIDSSRVALRVMGTTNVSYVVQAGTTLTNWSTLHTKVGGPFTITNAPTQSTFYRVLVNDQVPSAP